MGDFRPGSPQQHIPPEGKPDGQGIAQHTFAFDPFQLRFFRIGQDDVLGDMHILAAGLCQHLLHRRTAARGCFSAAHAVPPAAAPVSPCPPRRSAVPSHNPALPVTDMRQQAGLLRRHSLAFEHALHLRHSCGPQPQHLAAGDDGRQQLLRLVGDQDQDGICGRLPPVS